MPFASYLDWIRLCFPSNLRPLLSVEKPRIHRPIFICASVAFPLTDKLLYVGHLLCKENRKIFTYMKGYVKQLLVFFT